MRSRRRLLAGAVIVAAGVYLAILAASYVFQRSLMYFPDPRPTPPDADGPPIQVIHLTTADGERLVAWYLPPKGDKPIILHFNGNGGGLAIQRGRWRRIADAGVGFMAVGYRGYAGSTGRPTEAGLHEDARTAYRWLTERYDPERIVLHGYSLGSGVAVRLAAEERARALVLETPYTSAVDLGAEKAPLLPMRLLMRDRFESTRWIGQVDEPILIIHGDRDSVIPFAHGERLFRLAPEPKQFVRMHGGDHNTLTKDGLYSHVWKFLKIPGQS